MLPRRRRERFEVFDSVLVCPEQGVHLPTQARGRGGAGFGGSLEQGIDTSLRLACLFVGLDPRRSEAGVAEYVVCQGHVSRRPVLVGR